MIPADEPGRCAVSGRKGFGQQDYVEAVASSSDPL